MNRTEQNPDLTAFTSKIQVFCRPEWTKEGTPWKRILTFFKYKSEYHETVRAQKVDEKNGVICLVSFFPSWVTVLKLLKIVHFCKFVLTSERNLNLLNQFIYIHLKDLIMLFQRIVCFIGVWATVHEILRIKISKKCWFSRNLMKLSDSNANIF